MILRKISIINYRNIETANIELSPKFNCFVGKNGMGKTNFLDAVYYLSFCRSNITTVDAQVLRHEQEFFVIEGDYTNETGDDERIYCGMKRGQRKHFKRNKKEYKRLSQHIGLIPIIYVSPYDTNIIDSGSDERRRMMDMVIAQYDNEYLQALNNYNKALQQRNALLKVEEEPDPLLFDMWEQQMASEGTTIFQKRTAFVEHLKPVFERIYKKVANADETVSLNYSSHGQRGDLLEVIQRDRAKDRIMGFSLHGIHRDELEMTLDGYPVKREGSQGQHKTFAIALKLAQFDFLKNTNSKTTPILLLDDIFDKLDASRVQQIISLVAGDDFGQIFITDTNRQHLDGLLRQGDFDYRLFSVEDGKIQLVESRMSEDNNIQQE
ncbi:MAG: DNA replication/repair protein RecF [Prevotella sp.]|nr:DNA replication/repair protein RecF [Prevotella sp.]